MSSHQYLCCIVVILGALAAGADDGFRKTVLPFFDSHCSDCHMDGETDGDVDLDTVLTARDLALDVRLVHKIRRVITTGEMPPEKKKRRPSKQEIAAVSRWLEQAPQTVSVSPPHDPGRPVIRRLNRTELGYALQDLLGTPEEIMDSFPPDDTGYGFDTYGPVLNVTALHFERWLTIAENAVEIAFPDHRLIHNQLWPIALRDLQPVLGSRAGLGSEGLVMPTNGTVLATFAAPAAGAYKLEVTLAPQAAGDEAPSFRVSYNDQELASGDLPGPTGTSKTVSSQLALAAADHTFGISFLNDFWDPEREYGDQDRNLIIREVRLRGPSQPTRTAPTEAQKRYRVADNPAPAKDSVTARRVILEIATTAWRRHPTADEVQRLGRIYVKNRQGTTFQTGLRSAVMAILASPAFLYRQEPPPPNTKPGSVVALSQPQLATRMALLLWRSLPDAILRETAAQNRLGTDAQIRKQINRMLADPRAERFARDFCGQWLMLRMLDEHQPARSVFESWSPAVVTAMRNETEWLFLDVLRSNASVMDLLHSRRALLDPQLAQHYGIAHSDSPIIKPEHRPGILGHASILTLTSHPQRSSPVRRGKFVLDQLLGMPPPPAPGDIPALEEPDADDEEKPKTVREALVAHRSQADCMGCHSKLDPYGFALEGFDPVGRYLGNTENPPDASATMLDGTKIDGLNDLVAAIDKDRELVVRTLVEKLLVYSLGRGITRDDYPLILDLTRNAAKDDYPLRDILEAVILSDAFRKQRLSNQ